MIILSFPQIPYTFNNTKTMKAMRRVLLSLFLICFSSYCAISQSLSGEARSHWNKSKVYMENAKAEAEWQLAVNELEALIQLSPDYAPAYLQLGEAYSHIPTSEAFNKATSSWRKYAEMVPKEAVSIQDKIDCLEATFTMTQMKNQDAILQSVIGRWRGNPDDSSEFGKGEKVMDMEIFRDGDKVMLKYVPLYYSFNDKSPKVISPLEYKEVFFDGNSLVIEYKQNWEDCIKKDGRVVDSEKTVFTYRFVVSAPPKDNVLPGTRSFDYITTDTKTTKSYTRQVYIYKVR